MTKDEHIAVAMLLACVAFVAYRKHGETKKQAAVSTATSVALDPMAWLGAIGAA